MGLPFASLPVIPVARRCTLASANASLATRKLRSSYALNIFKMAAEPTDFFGGKEVIVMGRILILAALVSSANIALNISTTRAAGTAESWPDIFKSTEFASAFVAGIVSLIMMTTLYYVGRGNQFGMASGILLMGALSMIGGTIIGFFLFNAKVQ
jgi:hypothetical protein